LSHSSTFFLSSGTVFFLKKENAVGHRIKGDFQDFRNDIANQQGIYIGNEVYTLLQ
jgi:hypothetical protein